MSRITPIVLAASLSLLPSALSAQRCLGNASFADRRAHVGADAAFSPDGRSVGGALAFGFPRGPFASVGFGTTHNDDLDDDATLFTATAGVGIPLGPTAKTQLCPFISAVVVNGVELPFGERLSSQAFGFGASVGRTLNPTATLEVVPSVAGALVTQQITVYSTPGGTLSITDSHHAVSFGAGLVLAKVITVRPFTTLTFAEGETNSSYGLHVSFGFVGATHRPRAVEGAGSEITVWVNTRARVYYCPASPSYGATPQGDFMTEREALASGATPASGKRC
jgi:hypothetical protein